MTTVRELFDGDAEFVCPECERICHVRNDIDLDGADGVGVTCYCGKEQEFRDVDAEVNEPNKYHGHRIGYTSDGILCCADCDMDHISIDYHDCSKAIYNLYRLGKYKNVECRRNTLLEDLAGIAKRDRKI